MPSAAPAAAAPSLTDFIALCGENAWAGRLAALAGQVQPGSLASRAAQHRHALELALARLGEGRARSRATPAEQLLCRFAQDAVELAASLPPGPREKLRAELLAGLQGAQTLIPTFHLLRTAARLRGHGFAVTYTGLAEGTPHDLLAQRGGATAEVVCETVSAEEGRPVHRGDWFALVDRINPELQTWLAAHPGRYLLKMTLPEGIAGPEELAELHRRISDMLAAEKRQDAGAQAILKLDPLTLAGAQLQDAQGGLPARLRAQFGHEAHLAVTADASSGSVFALAARAGQRNEISGAVCRRLQHAAEARLSGRYPGILDVFLEDLDRSEWRMLREQLELEGAVRRWLTAAAAKRVVAVSCTSRFEMFGAPDAAAGGELRYRNPAHPAAKHPGLAPAVLSSM